jgi:KaiC/GvpD/RAD55 family RecA-like ATPase
VRVSAHARTLDPFAGTTPVKSSRTSGVLTGIGVLDNKTGGLGKGECGLIIGHSGSGKTAVASFMMRQMALHGQKVLYLSAEEPAENIIHRLYAQQFKIDYTEMYRGNKEMEKQQAFGELDNATREKLQRIRVIDIRDLTPIGEKGIQKVLEQQADAGFIPDAVIIDQMDYLRPEKGMAKDASKWQLYENVAFEMDHLSQYKIQDTHEIALWVLHQATGAPVWTFDYNQIAGFKGIVKQFDMVLGIGRESSDSSHINIFSLKVRHSEMFTAPHRADFNFMSFTPDLNYKPAFMQDKKKSKSKKEKSDSNEMAENSGE